MRLARAIERYLQYARIERDFTARSLESYYRVLVKLDDAYPDTHVHDFEGREGKRRVLEVISAFSRGRRPNVVSIYHSFFRWLEAEDLLEDDRVRTIQRPPRRRADVYRPPVVDRELAFRVTTLHERAPWLLMDKVGLRASEVCALRWADVDLRLGEVHVAGKGGHRDVLPVIPEALEELRRVYSTLAPEPDHHVFTVEVEHWQGPNRIRRVRDPLKPARSNSLWGMVQRICKRAGIKPFGPHALRHAFATSFLRDSDRDVMSLQKLMRHSSLETTRGYVDELQIEELRAVLNRVTSVRQEGNEEAGAPQTESCARHDSNMRSESSGSESAAASDSDPGLDPESDSHGGHEHGD